jgi:hypothetical protein
MNISRVFRSFTIQSTCRRYNVYPNNHIKTIRRCASTSATSVPKARSVLLVKPTKAQLEEADVDLDVISDPEANVIITQRAAEVHYISANSKYKLTTNGSIYKKYQIEKMTLILLCGSQ